MPAMPKPRFIMALAVPAWRGAMSIGTHQIGATTSSAEKKGRDPGQEQPREAPGAPWIVAGLGVGIRPLIPATVAAGGHVRVGLEDAPHGTEIDNASWVHRAAAAIASAGGTLATASDVRAPLSGED